MNYHRRRGRINTVLARMCEPWDAYQSRQFLAEFRKVVRASERASATFRRK